MMKRILCFVLSLLTLWGAVSPADARSITELDDFLDSLTPREQAPAASPEVYRNEAPPPQRPASMESWVSFFQGYHSFERPLLYVRVL